MVTNNTSFSRFLVAAMAMVGFAFFGMISASNAAEPIVKIRIGTVVSGDHPENIGALKIKEIVEAKSGGRVTVQVFTSGTIGDQRTMVENLRNGVLEMTWVTTGFFGSYEPILNALECGYLFQNSEHSYKVFDGPLGVEVKELIGKHGVKPLGFFEAGMRHITSNKAINSPADLKGLKIRTPQAKYHLNTLKLMGANPIAMSMGELYSAMQTGVVDGQENPFSNIYTQKFYEVNKYLALTGHLHLTHVVMYSEKLWNKLPDDIQAIVQAAVSEAQVVQRAAVRKDDTTLLEKLKANGMQVTQPDRDAFRNLVLPLREDAVREYGPKAKEWFDRIDAAK